MQYIFPDMDIQTRYRLKDYRDNLILFLMELIENNIYTEANTSVSDERTKQNKYTSYHLLKGIVSEIHLMSRVVDQDRVYNIYNIEDVIKETPGGKD